MHFDELYKFSDCTLQSVRDTLHDMETNLRMGYNKAMPRRRWSNLDKTRSHFMVKDIDRQLLERRLMRSLEKFTSHNYKLVVKVVFIPRSSQNQRNLPRDIPLDRIEIHRYDTKGVKVIKEIMQTKTELTLEQTQQGVSDEDLNFNKDDYISFQDQEKYEHVSSKVRSTQEGKISQDDDMRLYLADDLKKLKDHTQVKLKGTISSLKSKDHYTYHKMKDKESRPRAKTKVIGRMLSLRFFVKGFTLLRGEIVSKDKKRLVTPKSIARGPLDSFWNLK
ncbi:hypothetical protein Tco_0237619 [Tanacetum coccineum]